MEILCWKLTRVRPMWRFSNHVSDPNKRTAYTTAFKKNPKTLGLAPSRPRIFSRRAHLFRAFRMYPTNAGQLSSTSVKTSPGI